MGNLAVITDLHADINHFNEQELEILFSVLNEQQVTRLHFAGDTANQIEQTLAVNQFFRHRGLPTTFNLGNHEMGKLKGEQMIEHYPDSHFLNLRYLPLNQRTVLLGFNGWYDYSFSETKDPQQNRSIKNIYWFDRIIERFSDDQTVNQAILHQLREVLDDLAQKNYQVILATHFVPKAEFVIRQSGNYQVWNKLNAFLGSQALGELLDQYPNIRQVVFGHTHRRFEDQLFHDTIYSCRPLGYYYEWKITRDFVLANQLAEVYLPMKMRSLLKKHQAEFAAYQERHLIEEFCQAITLIPY
ncbi:metallophosphoesterase [Enterococcus xiangfangensis]|uniref:Metallophosphoesterase n=1 Tax=Enterococcus xiangfangensis TaxID=1296537 RepID=A0ABU3FBA2_9ENTE|nr:metallophosphoesterase [Enterococcus xiangfangensis]MDT2759948.1 metallophosphoesterase [Enterococcus xiangfangensis]